MRVHEGLTPCSWGRWEAACTTPSPRPLGGPKHPPGWSTRRRADPGPTGASAAGRLRSPNPGTTGAEVVGRRQAPARHATPRARRLGRPAHEPLRQHERVEPTHRPPPLGRVASRHASAGGRPSPSRAGRTWMVRHGGPSKAAARTSVRVGEPPDGSRHGGRRATGGLSVEVGPPRSRFAAASRWTVGLLRAQRAAGSSGILARQRRRRRSPSRPSGRDHRRAAYGSSAVRPARSAALGSSPARDGGASRVGPCPRARVGLRAAPVGRPSGRPSAEPPGFTGRGLPVAVGLTSVRARRAVVAGEVVATSVAAAARSGGMDARARSGGLGGAGERMRRARSVGAGSVVGGREPCHGAP